MGKIQMSKVKTIEWSTTPFCLLCLVTSRLVEKVISLGWGRYGGQNSNLGGHPFLESVFLPCGESKSLGRNSQDIMHPWLSFLTHHHGVLAPSRSKKRESCLLHGLAVVSFPSPHPECILGVVGVNGKKGAMILCFEEAVFPPVSNLGASLTFLCIFPFFSKLESSFLGCQWIGEDTHDFWVVDESIFSHMKPLEVF